MICPHCRAAAHPHLTSKTYTPKDLGPEQGIEVAHGQCPGCDKLIVLVRFGHHVFRDGDAELESILEERVVYPQIQRRVLSAAVPPGYADSLSEAAAVAQISGRASAALSRRLLQTVLREHFDIKKPSLEQEIDAFLSRPDLPELLRKSVDAIRQIGNFAAHPTKSTNTGEIVDVECDEVDLVLDACEWLLDYAFVQPAVLEERRERLESKLTALGKPPLK